MPQGGKRFEDLIAWRKARVLTAEVYKLTEGGRLGRDFGLRDQMRRSAVSIMSNIAEGFERNRLAEFHQFLSMAKGSCAELRSHLYVARDAAYIDGSVLSRILQMAEEVGRITGGLRASIERERSMSPQKKT